MNFAKTPMPPNGPRLITDDEVAQMLKVSKRQLHRMKSRGDTISHIKIGRLTRWNLEEVEEWIRNGCPSAGSDQTEGGRSDG